MLDPHDPHGRRDPILENRPLISNHALWYMCPHTGAHNPHTLEIRVNFGRGCKKTLGVEEPECLLLDSSF